MEKLHKSTRDLTIIDVLYDRDIRNYCIYEVWVLCMVINFLGTEIGFIERPELDPKTAFIILGIWLLVVVPFIGNLYMKYVVGVKD